MVTTLAYCTIGELAQLVASRKVSPVDVVAECLGRIEQHEPKINSFALVLRDYALEAAKYAEAQIGRGNWLGPLHGIPVGIKDLYETGGVRTTASSKVLADYIPKRDAAAVSRLKQAGAIILGKTHTHEFAYGATCLNPHYGPVRNPWDPRRISGGSSGGSAAALAAGFVVGALGSDTGGSIRIPAAACGVVGLKATYDLISRDGVIPLSWSLDHAGPLARSVSDIAILLDVLVHGYGRSSPAQSGLLTYLPVQRTGLKNFRLAVASHSYKLIQPEIREVFSNAVRSLENLGAEIDEVSIDEVEDAYIAWYTILLVEATAYHEPFLRERAHDYGEDVLIQLEAGRLVTGTQYLKAQQYRRAFNRRFELIAQRFDAILLPTLPVKPPLIEERELEFNGVRISSQEAMIHFTWLANFTGYPAISVPCGLTSDRLPVGLMIMGPPFSERHVLEIALAFESASSWKSIFPEL